jgi:hypothetical protein
MDALPDNLGLRIIELARIATAMHLEQTIGLEGIARFSARHEIVGGADVANEAMESLLRRFMEETS